MHAHDAQQTERRFITSLLLTGLIFLAELVGGFWTGSLALLSDAAHVFLDVFALGLSYSALRLSARPADEQHTFGYHRLEVLAALVNGLTLAVIAIGIFGESWERWQAPQPVKSGPMLVIAIIGLVVNLVVALVLGGHSHTHDEDAPHDHAHTRQDLNLHSAFLHVVGDAVSSLGVIIAGLLIWQTGWLWIDPLMSVLIGLMILWSAGRVLRGSLHILLEGTPVGVSLEAIARTMTSTPGVTEVHDLHVWSLCSGHIALSAHVVADHHPGTENGLVLMELQRRLKSEHGIEHTTIQIEPAILSSELISL